MVHKLSKKNIKRLTSLNYLGNNIIDPILSNKTDKKYLFFDSEKIKIFPEREMYTNNKHALKFLIQSYRDFYFSKRNSESIIKNSQGIIYLHNSWTPSKYKNMSEKEFLEQDILLSKLLAKTLNIKT